MNERFLRLAALMALSSAAMFGTTVTIHLGSSPFPNGTSAPFSASIDGITAAVICDDDVHVVDPNETWTATVSTLSSLLSLGNSNIANGSIVEWKNLTSSGLHVAATLYEEAAWLAYQFSKNPTSDWGGIQNAIWDLFLQQAGSGTGVTSSAYWMAQASANYTTLTTTQIANVLILTPVSGTQNPLSDGMPQEFFTIVPEPSTYALFGAALILLSLGTFHRKSRK